MKYDIEIEENEHEVLHRYTIFVKDKERNIIPVNKCQTYEINQGVYDKICTGFVYINDIPTAVFNQFEIENVKYL